MACDSVNKNKCACTYVSCPRHGKCCACVEYHKRGDELPGCFFSEKGERTYDRSISNFIKDRAK